MNIDKTNKTEPILHKTSFHPQGYKERVHHYRFFFYAAKHKGKYKLKDRYFVSYRKPVTDPEKYALESTLSYISKGRYSDFFFVREPINQNSKLYEDSEAKA